MTMNFRIVENGESAWDKEPELIKLYQSGVPVAEIRKRLSIAAPTFNKMVQQFKKEGKITARRKTYKKRDVKKRQPKYYIKVRNRKGFNIVKGGKYYGYVSTKEQAIEFVRLMKECDWDRSQRHIVKKKVVQSE